MINNNGTQWTIATLFAKQRFQVAGLKQKVAKITVPIAAQ
jgi:hypothetical protein